MALALRVRGLLSVGTVPRRTFSVSTPKSSVRCLLVPQRLMELGCALALPCVSRSGPAPKNPTIGSTLRVPVLGLIPHSRAVPWLPLSTLCTLRRSQLLCPGAAPHDRPQLQAPLSQPVVPVVQLQMSQVPAGANYHV